MYVQYAFAHWGTCYIVSAQKGGNGEKDEGLKESGLRESWKEEKENLLLENNNNTDANKVYNKFDRSDWPIDA